MSSVALALKLPQTCLPTLSLQHISERVRFRVVSRPDAAAFGTKIDLYRRHCAAIPEMR